MQAVLRRRGDPGLVARRGTATVWSAAPAGVRLGLAPEHEPAPGGRRRSRRPRRTRAGSGASGGPSLPRQRSRRRLRERLGERVDHHAEPADLGLGQRRCRARSRRPSRAGAARRPPARSDARSRPTRSGSLPASAGRMASKAARAPSHVGREVEQVDVRVALLLAGDLRLRDLAEQLVGAVADLRGLELDRAHEALRARASRPRGLSASARCPSSCPAPTACARSGESPSTATLGTSLARASMRGSRSPKLSATGSIALVGHARLAYARRAAARSPPASAAAQRLDARHQRGGLALEERAVAVDAALQRRARAPAARARRSPSSAPCLVLCAGAAQRVAARLQREREALRQAVGDVLDLGQDPVAAETTSYSVDREASLLVTTKVVGPDAELQRRRAGSPAR